MQSAGTKSGLPRLKAQLVLMGKGRSGINRTQALLGHRSGNGGDWRVDRARGVEARVAIL
jgi:hypothetical protein